MPDNTRDIKRRIKSIDNTKQIAKAMEMIAASKMKKAQENALAARPFAEKALDVLSSLSEVKLGKINPLLDEREVKNCTIMLVTTNKGLAGGMNSNVIKHATEIIDKKRKEGKKISIIAIGKKGRNFAQRTSLNIKAEFVDIGDSFESNDVYPVSKISLDDFRGKKHDEVIIVYTEFLNILKQIPKSRKILPVTKAELVSVASIGKDELSSNETLENERKSADKKVKIHFKFEPSAEEVLTFLLPDLVQMQIYQALLESKASEHSARMVAMKSAKENATEMISDLMLTFNQARQALITKELSEISGGVEALEAATS